MLANLRLSAVIHLLEGRSATLLLGRLEGQSVALRDRARNVLILQARLKDVVMRVKDDA